MKSFLSILLACVSLLSRAHAQNAVTGNLLLEAKGQVELYHNGKKISARNEAENKQHVRFNVPACTFKVGDIVVLRLLSPYTYRAAAVAFDLDREEAGQIPIKKGDWRFFGAGVNAAKIGMGDIQSSKVTPVTGTPDGNGISERDKLGMIPAAKGGSDWVASKDLLRDWYCLGFVVTAKMLKTPLPPP